MHLTPSIIFSTLTIISAKTNEKVIKCEINTSDCNLTFTKFCVVDVRNNSRHLGCQCDDEKYKGFLFDEYCVPSFSTGHATNKPRTSRGLGSSIVVDTADLTVEAGQDKIDGGLGEFGTTIANIVSDNAVNAESTQNTRITEKTENIEDHKNRENNKSDENHETTENKENHKNTKIPKSTDSMVKSTPPPPTTISDHATSSILLGPYIGADILLDNSTISEQFFCVGLRSSIHERKISPQIMIDPADIMRCSLIYSVLTVILVGLILSACCVFSTLTKVNAEGLTKQVYSTGRL